MHVVGLMGQQRKNVLPWQRTRMQQWEGHVFSVVCSKEVFSLRSVPRKCFLCGLLYNSDPAAVKLVSQR
jgi:hypothetical protein